MTFALAEEIHQLTNVLDPIPTQRRHYTVTHFQFIKRHAVKLGGEPHHDRLAQLDPLHIVGIFRIFHASKHRRFGAFFCRLLSRHIVDAHDHVLGRTDDRVATARLEQVLRGQHQVARFLHSRRTQRHVNGHLVAVKVSVKGATSERMQLNRAAFDQCHLKGLNAQAMQRRRTI